ncbi:MAG: zf-HC2 domain-containing protein [Chloroflexi bacterium]|nr:zf-HC2 domain-containing protein [Chloroflexota bacterium]
MQCLHASELMSLRLDGRIRQDEEASLQRHLADCAACRGQWERLQRLESIFADAPMMMPPPTLHAQVMLAVRRRNLPFGLSRRGALLVLCFASILLIWATSMALVTTAALSNPALVQAFVHILVQIAIVSRSIANALALVLKALLGGANWILLPGCLALICGMLIVWYSLVSAPWRLAWERPELSRRADPPR